MADNFTVTPGAGATIGADEITSVKYQRVKIIHGADGVNDGDVSAASPMPVVQTGTPALPTGAATAAKQLADNHNVVVTSAPTTAVTNAGITSIDGKITACNTGAVVLSSGTVTTVSTVTSLTQMNGQAIAMGTGTRSAGTQRVTIATDDSVPVTIASVPSHAVTNAGTFAVQSGQAAHDAAVSGSPVRVAGKSLAFGSATTEVSAAGDTVDMIADLGGIQFVNTHHPNSWSVVGDAYASAQTNTSLKAAPGAGLSLYITDVVISNGATAGTAKLIDGSGGATKVGTLYLAISGGCSASFKTPIKLTANTALCFTSATVTTHSVNVNGFTAP